MISIVDPKNSVAVLWGKQEVYNSSGYRLMKYVYRKDHGSKVYLYNVVTGQLILLSQEEKNALEALPCTYTPVMEQLVANHYLVPEDYDEHQQVKNLRRILWQYIESQKSNDITNYTILPTTACNARCYYCFEKEFKVSTMTEKTADEVVEYISHNAGSAKKVQLHWFGGEPTVAANRIDHICQGLTERGIDFTSSITTNGYLFGKELVENAKKIWKLDSVHISLDGTESNYNKIKSYITPADNPYQRVMKNVQLLLDRDIAVQLRMNFDVNNEKDFNELAGEIQNRFRDNPRLHVFVHPIVGMHPDSEGNIRHGSEEWFSKKIVELNEISRKHGLYRLNKELPSLHFSGCMATSKTNAVITPDGNLVRCSEQIGDDQIVGNVVDGVTNTRLVNSWKEFAEYDRCIECVFYPYCFRVKKCSIGDACTYKDEYYYRLNMNITEQINSMNL